MLKIEFLTIKPSIVMINIIVNFIKQGWDSMIKENSVFYISILLTTLFIIWGITPASWIQGYDLQSVTSSLNSFILNKFGWFYSLLMTAMIILAAYLAFSKYGSIRLGKDGEKPKYSYPSWLSMLFGAGMDSSFMESLNRFHTLQIH